MSPLISSKISSKIFMIFTTLILLFSLSFGLFPALVTSTSFAQSQTDSSSYKKTLNRGKFEKSEDGVTCTNPGDGNNCSRYTFNVYLDNSVEKHSIIVKSNKNINYRPGDDILVLNNAKDEYDIVSVYRADKYIWIILITLILLLVVFGLKIIKMISSSFASVAIVYYLLIPNIINNYDKQFYFTSISICFLIIGVITFINYGFSKKTTISFLTSSLAMCLISALILIIYDQILRIDSYISPLDISEGGLGNLSANKDFMRNIYYIISLVSISGIIAYVGAKQTETVFKIHEVKRGTLRKLDVYRLSVKKGFDDNQHIIPIVILMTAGFQFFNIMSSKQIPGLSIAPEIFINRVETAFAFANLMCVCISLILIIPLSALFALLFIKYDTPNQKIKLTGSEKKEEKREEKIEIKATQG